MIKTPKEGSGEGKEIYCLFYRDGKTERGYMTFFPLIPIDETDFEWIEEQFKYAITEGYEFPNTGTVFPYQVHGDSMFFEMAAPNAQGNSNNGNDDSQDVSTGFEAVTAKSESFDMERSQHIGLVPRL